MVDRAYFSIDMESSIPAYVQIKNQVQFAVAAGKLKPGDELPPVREMADTLRLNQNTVTKAFRELMLMGVVKTRRGVGITVSDDAPKVCRSSVSGMVKEHLREAVAECLAAGLTSAEIRGAVEATIEVCPAPYRATRQK